MIVQQNGRLKSPMTQRSTKSPVKYRENTSAKKRRDLLLSKSQSNLKYNLKTSPFLNNQLLKTADESDYRTYKSSSVAPSSPKPVPTLVEEHNHHRKRNEWEERYATKNIPNFSKV
jgi:ABC-type uncharacterized transport system YnjBCD substrate-binding protein